MQLNLRKKILIPLFLMLLGMAGAFIAIYQKEQQQKLDVLKQITLASIDAYYQSNIRARTKKLEVLADEIISEPAIVGDLKARNRAALLAALKDQYQIFRSVGDVTHLYFHTPDGINLLRVHQPDRYGDVIDRFTMKRAMKEGKMAAGVELGILGTLTLRMVKPVFQEGLLVGYIELGEEVGDIYETIISTLGVDIYLLVDESLLSRGELPSFVNSRLKRGVVPHEVLYQFDQNDMPNYLLKALKSGLDISNSMVEFNVKETHLLGLLPLKDAGDRVIGRVVVDRDITAMVSKSRYSVAVVSVVILLLWAVVCIVIYVVLGRFEKRFNSSAEMLHEKESALVNAARIAQLSTWTLNLETKKISCSEEFCELLGIDMSQAPTSIDELMLYIPKDDQSLFRKYMAAIITEEGTSDLLHRITSADGSEKWVKLCAARICTIDRKSEIVHVVVQDVTAAHAAETQATKLGSLLKYSWNEIYLFNNETLKFVEVSEGALRNLGYTLAEMQEMTPQDIRPEIDHKMFDDIIHHLHTGLVEQKVYETVHRRKDGTTYPVEVRLQYCSDVVPPLFMAIVQDITERQRYTSELERKALFDELTDLPNRALLCDRMGELIKQALRNNTIFVVLVVDIKRVKEIDDVLGYETGDELIKQVATRIVESLRKSDVVGHLGGGIFGLLLPLNDETKVNMLMTKLQRLLQVPVEVRGVSLDIDLCIGAALYPRHGDEPSLLLRHADMALQHAKAELQDFMIYEDEHHPFSVRRLQLIVELRQAIINDVLEVYYQPKINIQTGEVESVEALARWPQGKENLWVGPAEFIPLAEQSGLIRPLTELVMRHAIEQCRKWLDNGLDINIAINLSVRNLLDPALPEQISSLIAEKEVPAKNITLEITESMMMRQPDRAREILNLFHEQGVGISVDDYGTGYSSLAYLKQLPVKELKIDQNFIRTMLVDEDDAVIVRSTIELAHNLGLRVVAEGVEDHDTWIALTNLGCDLIQGYFVSRPLSAARFEEWYQRNKGHFAIT